MTRRGRWVAEHWMAIASPVTLLALWEWASATGLLREVFFPRTGTYVVRVEDRRAAEGSPPSVVPGTFCYSLSLQTLHAKMLG